MDKARFETVNNGTTDSLKLLCLYVVGDFEVELFSSSSKSSSSLSSSSSSSLPKFSIISGRCSNKGKAATALLNKCIFNRINIKFSNVPPLGSPLLSFVNNKTNNKNSNGNNNSTTAVTTIRPAILAIRLTLLGSSSYSINTVQPRTPQGSRSDTRTMSAAMRIVRSLGKDTSVQLDTNSIYLDFPTPTNRLIPLLDSICIFACTPPLIS
uniref:Uncharacterized protein n=1 Tax=Glossina pallidipes TaxID=7398 RepID=A0A1A9ZBS1_GLOPL